jgi:uncharacterized protein (TIGR02246 family)
MIQATIHSTIEKARTAWMTGDADAFVALFTQDGEFVIPGHVYRGVDEIRTVMADFVETHSNVEIIIYRIIIDGNQAVVEWHWEDTTTETGKRMIADDAIVVDFEGELIRRWREYIDAA